jgi:hypothetical protein
MEASLELRDLMTNFFRAVTTGDAAYAASALSRQPGVLGVGTDPAEWWTDYSTLQRVMTAQVGEMAGIRFVPTNPQAYQEGSVGWAADQPTIYMPDGSSFTMRVTLVFHREGAEWKIIQFHASVGAQNEDVLGQTLTVE